jgi:hypothetical protein
LSLLLLFRPRNAGGGPPPPPPPVIVTHGGIRKRHGRGINLKDMERESVAEFLKAQLRSQFPPEPEVSPLEQIQAKKTAERLRAEQEREAAMRKAAQLEAEMVEKKRLEVERYNRQIMELITRIFDDG